MFRFSHTALKTSEENTSVVAVFTNKPETTALATNFNFKSAPGRKRGEMRMTLNQLDFCLATANDHDMVGQLRAGRSALVQRERYEEHKLSAPPAEAASASV